MGTSQRSTEPPAALSKRLGWRRLAMGALERPVALGCLMLTDRCGMQGSRNRHFHLPCDTEWTIDEGNAMTCYNWLGTTEFSELKLAFSNAANQKGGHTPG